MAALTKLQLEHAKAKIAELSTARTAALVKKIGPRPKATEYTDAEKYSMVVSNKAHVNIDRDLSARQYMCGFDVFTFPRSPAMKKQDREVAIWDAALKEETDKLNVLKSRLLDELIMSPDGMDALAKITAAFDTP